VVRPHRLGDRVVLVDAVVVLVVVEDPVAAVVLRAQQPGHVRLDHEAATGP
jgi:hypothetical protein